MSVYLIRESFGAVHVSDILLNFVRVHAGVLGHDDVGQAEQ